MRQLCTMISALAVTAALLVGGCGNALAENTPVAPQALDQVERLMAAGEYEACLTLIEQWQKDILSDPSLRMSVWEIDFMGSEVVHALVGSSHLYFTYHASNSNRNAPGMKPTLELVKPSRHSDWRYVVVCVDARTGRILWSRPFGGSSRLAVDPATDTLYLLGNDAIVALSPDGAEPMVRPLVQKGKVIGLLTKSGITVSAPHGLRTDWNRDSVSLYCTTTRSLVAANLRERVTLSPDESKRLVLSTGNHHGFDNNLICQTTRGKHLWSFQVAGLRSPCMPQFYKGDVIWMSGTTVQKGQVVRLDGQTGKMVWKTVLPNGAYKPSDHQLKGGGYAWDDWDALMSIGDGRRLLAIDGTGRLFFLDGATGKILRTARLMETHLCAPTEVGELMVFCGHDGARAVPKSALMEPGKQRLDERGVLVLKARCLVALGRLKEALSSLDYVLARDEDCAEAWRVRAEVCGRQGNRLEQSFSLCRYAQLAGRKELPELRDLCGLLRLIPLGSRPAWQMVDVGGREVYVGTQRGDLWAVWPESLETRVVQSREKEIYGLSGSVRLSFCALTGGTLTDAKARSNPTEPTEAPEAWFNERGVDGPTVFFRDKYYRPLGGGKVRIWDGQEMVERESSLKGIKEWKIYVSPSGPLGYGMGGVYALDGDLCPTRMLIEPRAAGRKVEQCRVISVRNVGDSLGLVVQTSKGAYLQVYGRTDGRMRKEVYLGKWLSSWCYSPQFLVLGDGYLFSDRQLTWVSGRAGGSVWRFGPPVSHTEKGREWWRYFGDPVLRDGKLLVVALDGWLYAFDIAHIINTKPTDPHK
ncbi:MAG: PQQ-binding-like beta-propeller repeat protein [Phycisphaerae bacterium]|nr:PQQ-binding-like beta-propeller repeat protein [Phycisphaerae bacterium]